MNPDGKVKIGGMSIPVDDLIKYIPILSQLLMKFGTGLASMLKKLSDEEIEYMLTMGAAELNVDKRFRRDESGKLVRD